MQPEVAVKKEEEERAEVRSKRFFLIKNVIGIITFSYDYFNENTFV